MSMPAGPGAAEGPGPPEAGRRTQPGDPAGAYGEFRGLWPPEGLATAAPGGDQGGTLHGRPPHAAAGLKGVIRGKAVKTTVPDKTAACPLDKVQRQFRAPAPNRLWLSDFTYVSTWQGFAYVALHHRRLRPTDRRLAGLRAMPGRTLCSTPLEQALHARQPSAKAALFITRTADLIRQHSLQPSAWLKQASNLPSAASEIRMTMPSRKRSTASTRQRSSIAKRPGKASRLSNSRPLPGSIGSTTVAFSSRSAIFHPLRPRQTTYAALEPMPIAA